MDSFGSILKKTRKESEFKTLEALAVAVGVSRQSLGHYETGTRFPDTETLRKIALALRVSSDYLLGLTDVKSPDTSARSICKETRLSEKAVEILKRDKSLCGLDFTVCRDGSAINAIIEETGEKDGGLLGFINTYRLEMAQLESALSDIRNTPPSKKNYRENLLETIPKEEEERAISIKLGGLYWLCEEKFIDFLKKYVKTTRDELDDIREKLSKEREDLEAIAVDDNLIDRVCSNPEDAIFLKSYLSNKEDTNHAKE